MDAKTIDRVEPTATAEYKVLAEGTETAALRGDDDRNATVARIKRKGWLLIAAIAAGVVVAGCFVGWAFADFELGLTLALAGVVPLVVGYATTMAMGRY